MPVENDFVPMAAEPGANVVAVATYVGSGFQETGQQPGIGLSAYFNRIWRQGSMGMAVLAAFIVDILNENVLDSGYGSGAAEVAALEAQFKAALSAFISGGGASPTVIPVAFSATPVFDCHLGNRLQPVFEITLTGNVTGSTMANLQPGQLITFIIKQDGTGGWTFVWPVVANNAGAPDPTLSTTSVQTFIVDAASNLQAVSGITG